MKLLFVHDRFGAQAGAESNLSHTAAELQRRGHVVGLAHGPGPGQGEEGWRLIFTDRYDLSAGDPAEIIGTALEEFRPNLVYLHTPPGAAVIEALAEVALPVVRMVHDHQLFCLRGCKYPAWSRRPCTRALSPWCVFPCGGFVPPAAPPDPSFPLASYLAEKPGLETHRSLHRLIFPHPHLLAHF